MTKTKTVFMGSDAISLPLLNFIQKNEALDLIAVYTQPDRPSGRGRKVKANEIKQWALEQNIEVRQPLQVNQSEYEYLRERGAELILVMAYGHLLKDEFLQITQLPVLNFHAAKLPELRGASPIETAIASGRDETAVSLMKIIRKMDAGAVADLERVPIGSDMKREDLYAKIGDACVPLIERNLNKILSNQLDFVEQDENKVSYCRILNKDDSNISFKISAKSFENRVRALHPWPGSFFNNGEDRIKVAKVEILEETSDAKPGEVIAIQKSGLDVATESGVIRLLELQRPGGKMMDTASFLRGYPIEVGTVLTGQEAEALEAPKAFKRKK